MAMVVNESWLEDRIRAERQAAGSDRWDEVWDGVYMLMPLPNIEHQGIVAGLVSILQPLIGWPGLGAVFPGVNVSDQDEDWTHNYRCPDVAVFLRGTSAINRDTYWLGGPDFAVEIVSDQDRSREKLDFYAAVNVRELLLVDRRPWALELYRLRGGRLDLVGRSTPDDPAALASEVLPLRFRLVPGEGRPAIEVAHRDGDPTWRI